MKWGVTEYFAFALGKLELKPNEFWELTYQELYISMLAYGQRLDDKLWLHGDLLAHIYNCWMQKPDKTAWTYRDFVRLSMENTEKKEKLTLKKAKQSLGSTFKLHDN